MLLKPPLYVSLESVVFGTLDGRAFEEGAVLLFREVLPVVGCHLQEGFGGLKGWFFGGFGFSELWRGSQASVAAIECSAQSDAVGQRPTVLDGHVADAASGVEAIGGEGRTGNLTI